MTAKWVVLGDRQMGRFQWLLTTAHQAWTSLPGVQQTYMMDGSIKANTLKPNDQITARSVTRLMGNEKGRLKALLMERVYSNVADEAVSKSLINRACRKAEAMKLPLVSKEVGEGPAYPDTLYFLGGRAPYTYSDASGGVNAGPFSISGLHTLYTPPKELDDVPPVPAVPTLWDKARQVVEATQSFIAGVVSSVRRALHQ